MLFWMSLASLAWADPAKGVQPPNMGVNGHFAVDIPESGLGGGFGVFVQLPIFLKRDRPYWVLSPEFGWNIYEFDYSYEGSARDGLASGTRLGGIYGGFRFASNVWHSKPKVAGKKKKKKALALGRTNFNYLIDVGPVLYGGGQFVVESSAVSGWKKPLPYVEPGVFVHFQLGPAVGVGVVASQRLMFTGPDPVEPWTTVALELDFAGLGLLEIFGKK